MSDSIKLKSNWKSITFVTALASIFMLNVTEANGEIRGIDGIHNTVSKPKGLMMARSRSKA